MSLSGVSVVADVQILIQRHPTKSSKRRVKRRASTARGRRVLDENSDSDGAMSARSHRRKYSNGKDDRFVTAFLQTNALVSSLHWRKT